MPNIKGNALGGLKRYVEETHGAAGFERWLADVPKQHQEAVRAIVLPAAWYPVLTWNVVLQRYVDVFGAGKPESFKPVAEFIAANDLTKIFKVLLTLASPSMVLGRVGFLWERYFDVGTLSSVQRTAKSYVITLDAPTGQAEGPDKIICSVGVPQWLVRALQMTGAKSATASHVRCRFNGAPKCETEMSWVD
ncbi:MAG: hypothetical protein AB2A00_40655 [Myxococcota bacterium]